ncbi:hypothetical protein BDV23DRAFT_74461 [Aspergillus alliaceus]|uniref:Uncharacterized protein n=1 Tax=Petromyces alliaceus TaxID=209559 RepID=A0A5N7CAT5_PETAA|nr:hypothetical protein BDV23DRAFT_74461 [Aspergillus alliaceus]
MKVVSAHLSFLRLAFTKHIILRQLIYNYRDSDQVIVRPCAMDIPRILTCHAMNLYQLTKPGKHVLQSTLHAQNY